MKGLTLKLHRFRVAQDGATAVHFAVMLALIAIVWLTAVASLTGGTTGTH
jgi:Flp pilus assembly pilin Flp